MRRVRAVGRALAPIIQQLATLGHEALIVYAPALRRAWHVARSEAARAWRESRRTGGRS